jgi:predicted SprT family Zn-dependent metalloprotease
MARRGRRLEDEKTRGQGFLFPLFDEPSAAPPDALPDLDGLFRDLNDRFFAGRLEARLEWSKRLTAVAGTCRPQEGLIRVSESYHRRRPEALPVTIAHEMIHLFEPRHGRAFREIGGPIAEALGVGWDEFRYSERWADLSRYRYLYACPGCGLEFPSKKRRTASCGRCAPRGYDDAFRLVLTESRAKPGPVLRGERPVRLD